jgi:hypothetical protein
MFKLLRPKFLLHSSDVGYPIVPHRRSFGAHVLGWMSLEERSDPVGTLVTRSELAHIHTECNLMRETQQVPFEESLTVLHCD